MAFTEYADTAAQARKAWARTTESWTNGVQKLLGQVPTGGVGTMDPRRALDQSVGTVERIAEVNREYVQHLAEASLEVRKAVVDYSTTIAGVLRDQVGATVDAARGPAEKAAHDATVNDYSGLTKAELSDLLAARHLPRTGTIGELRARLIESDQHAS
jgi:hypothetical protein